MSEKVEALFSDETFGELCTSFNAGINSVVCTEKDLNGIMTERSHQYGASELNQARFNLFTNALITEAAAVEAKRLEVIEFGEQFGISEFAVISLRHLLGNVPVKDLIGHVIEGEEKLSELDEFITDHSGQVLTVVDGFSVKAGRVSKSGLELDERTETKLVIPSAEGRQAYAMSINEVDAIVQHNDPLKPIFAIETSTLINSSNTLMHEGWSLFAHIGDPSMYAYARPLFVVGEVTNAKFNPATINPADVAWFERAFDRIKLISQKATAA